MLFLALLLTNRPTLIRLNSLSFILYRIVFTTKSSNLITIIKPKFRRPNNARINYLPQPINNKQCSQINTNSADIDASGIMPLLNEKYEGKIILKNDTLLINLSMCVTE